MFKNLSETKKGILALVLTSFFGALMGVWVRIMNQELGVYQQIFGVNGRNALINSLG